MGRTNKHGAPEIWPFSICILNAPSKNRFQGRLFIAASSMHTAVSSNQGFDNEEFIRKGGAAEKSANAYHFTAFCETHSISCSNSSMTILTIKHLTN